MEGDIIQETKSQEFDFKVWMNELRFYEDELKLFEHQLEQLVAKNIKESLPSLEQFQNNFIRQNEVLDELRHQLKIHENATRNVEMKTKVIADRDLSYEEFQDRIKLFRKIFAELKEDFVDFMNNW